MTSVRIVVIDHYICAPESGMDPLMSDFRGAPVAKVPVLRIFGPDNKGEKACVHVHGVFPYMYVPCEGQENAKILSYQIASSLDKALNISMGQTASNHQHVYKIEIISAIPFYGYHSKEHQFFKIHFYNPRMIKRASELLQNGTVLGKIFQPHECHIPYHQQFMIDYNLHGMSFVRISRFRPRSASKKVSVCDVEMDVAADVILNKYEISQGKVTTNPGIQYIKDDEMQRRRNKGEDTQLSPCLTQNRDDVKATVTHETFKQFLKTKLECEADAGIPSSSDASLDVSSLQETSLLNCSVLDDAEFLLNMLKDNENVEEDSILSQVPTVEDESDNEHDLTMPLESVTTPVKIRSREDESSDEDLWNDSLFERTVIPQVDGATDNVTKPWSRRRKRQPANKPKLNDCVIRIPSNESFEIETVEGKSLAVFHRSPIVLRKRNDLSATGILSKNSKGGQKKNEDKVGSFENSNNKPKRGGKRATPLEAIVEKPSNKSDVDISSEMPRKALKGTKVVQASIEEPANKLVHLENDKTSDNKITTAPDVNGTINVSSKSVKSRKTARKKATVFRPNEEGTNFAEANTKLVPPTVESGENKISTEDNKVTSPRIALNGKRKNPGAFDFNSEKPSCGSKISEANENDVGDELNIPGTSRTDKSKKTTRDPNVKATSVPSINGMPEKTLRSIIHKKTTLVLDVKEPSETKNKIGTSVDVPTSSGYAKKAVKGKKNGQVKAMSKEKNTSCDSTQLVENIDIPSALPVIKSQSGGHEKGNPEKDEQKSSITELPTFKSESKTAQLNTNGKNSADVPRTPLKQASEEEDQSENASKAKLPNLEGKTRRLNTSGENTSDIPKTSLEKAPKTEDKCDASKNKSPTLSCETKTTDTSGDISKTNLLLEKASKRYGVEKTGTISDINGKDAIKLPTANKSAEKVPKSKIIGAERKNANTNKTSVSRRSSKRVPLESNEDIITAILNSNVESTKTGINSAGTSNTESLPLKSDTRSNKVTATLDSNVDDTLNTNILPKSNTQTKAALKKASTKNSPSKVSTKSMPLISSAKLRDTINYPSTSTRKNGQTPLDAKPEATSSRKQKKITEALDKVESMLTCLDTPKRKGVNKFSPMSTKQFKAKNRIGTPRKGVAAGNHVDDSSGSSRSASELGEPKDISSVALTRKNVSSASWKRNGSLSESARSTASVAEESFGLRKKKSSPGTVAKKNVHEMSHLESSRSLSELSRSTASVAEKSFGFRKTRSSPGTVKHIEAVDLAKKNVHEVNFAKSERSRSELTVTVAEKSVRSRKRKSNPAIIEHIEAVANEMSADSSDNSETNGSLSELSEGTSTVSEKSFRVRTRKRSPDIAFFGKIPKASQSTPVARKHSFAAFDEDELETPILHVPKRSRISNSEVGPEKSNESDVVFKESEPPVLSEGTSNESLTKYNKDLCGPQENKKEPITSSTIRNPVVEDVTCGEINNNRSDWQLKNVNLESVINRLFSKSGQVKNVPDVSDVGRKLNKSPRRNQASSDRKSAIIHERKNKSDSGNEEPSLYNMIQSVDFETMLNYESGCGESLKDSQSTSEEAFDIEQYLKTIFVKAPSPIKHKIATDADGLPVQNELTNLYYEPPPFTASDYQNTSWVCEESSASVDLNEDYGTALKRKFEEVIRKQEKIFEDFMAGHRRVLKNHHLDASLLLKESVPENKHIDLMLKESVPQNDHVAASSLPKDSVEIPQNDGQEDSSSDEDGSPKIVARKRRRRSAKKYRPLELVVKRSPSKTQSFLDGACQQRQGIVCDADKSRASPQRPPQIASDFNREDVDKAKRILSFAESLNRTATEETVACHYSPLKSARRPSLFFQEPTSEVSSTKAAVNSSTANLCRRSTKAITGAGVKTPEVGSAANVSQYSTRDSSNLLEAIDLNQHKTTTVTEEDVNNSNFVQEPTVSTAVIESNAEVCSLVPETIPNVTNTEDSTNKRDTNSSLRNQAITAVIKDSTETDASSYNSDDIFFHDELSAVEKYDLQKNFQPVAGPSKLYVTIQSSSEKDAPIQTSGEYSTPSDKDVRSQTSRESDKNVPTQSSGKYSTSSGTITPFQKPDDLEATIVSDEPEYDDNLIDFPRSNVIVPKYNSPSRKALEASMEQFRIPPIRNRDPFYGYVKHITGSVEVGYDVLKIKSRTVRDYEEFCSGFGKLRNVQTERLRRIHGELSGGELQRLKLSHGAGQSYRVQSVRRPPTRRDVELWLVARNIREGAAVKEQAVKRIVCYSPGGGNNDADDEDMSLTLTPCSPEPSLQNILQQSNLFESGNVSLANSHQITAATMDNTHGFKVSLENMQEARSYVIHQYITTVVMELHVQTRGNFKPDPRYDAINAVFYSVLHDAPDETTETGIIAVNSQNVSPGKVNSENVLDGTGISCSVTYVKSEGALFDKFLEFIRAWNPDIFVGYEIRMNSWGYLIDRGYTLGLNFVSQLARVPDNSPYKSDDDDAQSELKIVGRIVLDLWRLMKHELALQSYTFENIVYHVLHERAPKHTLKELTNWWSHRNPKIRHRTVDYYLYRVRNIPRIMDNFDLIGRTSELARLFGILFYEVLSRGSQFRVESMMLRLAKPMNYVPVSPSVQQRARMRAPEYLPLILEPESKFYKDPVIVLDFQSLYPSVIIAYNYCFSTCIGRLEHLGGNAPFEFGATQLKISKARVERFAKKDQLNFSPCGIAFVKEEVRRGILPRMLQEILDTRLLVKKAMKSEKGNKLLQRVLHSRQLGLKLIANVTYGYTAANFSGRMPAVEVGDSVVAKGRETLQRAISMVEKNGKWGARVVYGDTDSMFVLVPGRSREEAFRIGAEIAEAVTNDNPSPVRLKLEKVYQPCILQTKKRYVGYMYESVEQKEPELEAKGIETVRRDGCPAISKMLEKCLRILFETQDVSLVRLYVERQFHKLFSGRISIQDLTFAKEYRGMGGYKPGACVPALELVRKWKQVDPRNEPCSGERVPYVIVNGPPGLPLIKMVRSPTELLEDPALRPNALYYITKAIIPPINRCFKLIGADLHIWFNEMPRKYVQYLPTSSPQKKGPKTTISQYFSTMSCICCGRQTKEGVCDKCQGDTQKTSVILHEKIRNWESNHYNAMKICQSCCGRSTDINCTSLDCPVLYRTVQTHRDMQQISFVRELIAKLPRLEF